MIEYIKKDITTVTDGVIIQGVNCRGKMASGVAKAIYTKWPEVREQYLAQASDRRRLGKAHVVPISNKLTVLNCYTQEYYGRDGKVYACSNAIGECLGNAFGLFGRQATFYMPKIGCGLGGLDWGKDVEPIVREVAERYGVVVKVCEL